MIAHGYRVEGGRRVLVRLDVDLPDDERIDLNDASVLVACGLRPTEVVGHNRERTRQVAADRFLDGIREIGWWSWWRPVWRDRVLMAPLADTDPFAAWVTFTQVEQLTLASPAVTAVVLTNTAECGSQCREHRWRRTRPPAGIG